MNERQVQTSEDEWETSERLVQTSKDEWETNADEWDTSGNASPLARWFLILENLHIAEPIHWLNV